MRLGRVFLAVVVAALCAGCSQATRQFPLTRTTATTSTVAPSTTTVTAPVYGIRSFTIDGVTVSGTTWLTIGLSPTTVPVALQVTGGALAEVCPAGLDGGLLDSSWPASSGFRGCLRLSPTGAGTLPPAPVATHVAFAVKTVSATAPPGPLAVTVTYSAADSFVEVVPPTTTTNPLVTASYTPSSTTTVAVATPVHGIALAPGYFVNVTQGGPPLTQAVHCDFPTVLTLCLGGIAPGQPVQAQLVGHGGPVVLNLAWK